MILSEGQRAALENLAHKKAGDEVDWINIADARALTELGLAERDRSGWNITPAGASLLNPKSAADEASDAAAYPR